MFLTALLVSCVLLVSVAPNSAIPASGDFAANYSSSKQASNTISGYVFGPQRQPVPDITVELLDEYSRSIGRTRTNSTGRYMFNRVPSGRFRVRVMPLGTDYAEQEQEVEIININREIGGTVVPTAIENAQKDFYLRPRRNDDQPSKTDVIFAQDVPQPALELYRKGVNELQNKNEAEGLKALKSAIETFPDYFDAIVQLGSEYVRLGHYEAAEILLTRATQLNERSFAAWYGLAYALNSQNKNVPGIDAVKKAVGLNRSSVEAYLLDGALHRKVGKYADAEEHFKKAKKLADGPLPEANWQLALLYGNNLKRYGDAADELEQFLKAQPESKEEENIKKLIKQFREKAAANQK